MISVRIDGLDDVAKRFDELEQVSNTQDLLDTMGALMLHRIRERFLNEEAPDGSRWVDSYAAQRRKIENKGGGTLFDTGNLFHSISLGRHGENGRRIFTDVDYAAQHNFGEDGQWKREFLGFNEEDEALLNNLVENRIRSLL